MKRNNMDTSNLAGTICIVLGVLGGVVGTYFSIRNTNSPRERRFMIRAAVLVWLALGLTALVVYYLPTWRAWVWVPISIMVVVGVPLLNRRQEMIRKEDGRK